MRTDDPDPTGGEWLTQPQLRLCFCAPLRTTHAHRSVLHPPLRWKTPTR
jgi:hypothetical protein